MVKHGRVVYRVRVCPHTTDGSVVYEQKGHASVPSRTWSVVHLLRRWGHWSGLVMSK